jgi:hypothetical protein
MSGDKSFNPDRATTQRGATAQVPAIVPNPKFDDSRRQAPKAGRRHSPRLADTLGEQLTDEQVEAIRRRIADGVYDSREVAEEVARRLLESGDV